METSSNKKPWHARYGNWLLAALLCGVLAAQACWMHSQSSITFDETFYLSATLQIFHDRRLDERFTAGGVAPLPALVAYAAAAWPDGAQRVDPWRGLATDRPLVALARRATLLLFGVPLVLVVFFWARARHGLWAAAVAGGLCALSPNVVAHSALATTDIAFVLFALVALAALSFYWRRPGAGRMALAMGAVSLAMAVKYSGVFLLPIAGLVFLARAIRSAPDDRKSLARRTARGFARVAVLLAAAPLIVWGLAGFASRGPLKSVPARATPDDSPWVRVLGTGPVACNIMDFAHDRLPMPAPLAGFLAQMDHVRRGHREAPAFLLGERSRAGWWYYFPVVIAVKSTPSELAMLIAIAAGAGFAMVQLTAGRAAKASNGDIETWLWGGSIVLFLLLAIRAPLNIGVRHILVVYPLMILLGTVVLFRGLASVPRWKNGIGVGLVAVQAASAWGIAPNQLAYFNSLCGGPTNGYRILVDSNLDWGQDLPALADELERLGSPRILLHYFGSAAPEAYGIDFERLDERKGAIPPGCAYFAISATRLQGAYAWNDYFKHLRRQVPVARAGYSIFIYDLRDPAVRRAVTSAMKWMARVVRAAHVPGPVRDKSRGLAPRILRLLTTVRAAPLKSQHSNPAGLPGGYFGCTL